MNQLEQFREQCAAVCDEAKKNISPDYIIGDDVRNAGIACCENIAKRIRALPLPESVTEPSAYMVNEPLGGHDNWILTIPTLHSNAIPLYEAPPDFEALRKENDGLKEQLETERMRLAGCGVAANMNTADSIKDRITRDNPYWSASYGDVCSLVDREIALRDENEKLKESLRYAIKECEAWVFEARGYDGLDTKEMKTAKELAK